MEPPCGSHPTPHAAAFPDRIGRRPGWHRAGVADRQYPARRDHRQSARAEETTLQAESTACHLPALDRITATPGFVGLQTGAGAAKRPGLPAGVFEGKRFAFTSTSKSPKLLGTPRTFKQYGAGGIWMSDALPYLQTVADELCVINSMNTDQFNHAPAELFVFTGSPRPGRPSLGSWVTYGLGSENENLPGFVVLISSGSQPNGGKNSYGSGFVPSVYQGVQCRSTGVPVLYTSNPKGMDREMRRHSLDALRELNEIQAQELGHPETRTRIAQYELAFRMQTSVPEVMDVSRETQKTLDAYGAQPGSGSFANNCLLARRLVEQGVRYVQLFDWGWDFHGTNPKEDIRDGLTHKCGTMDKPIAALIRDLRQRGMLDDTLIVIGGEFGRTPFREGRTSDGSVLGRDHFPDCYTMVLAGGGVKGGYTHGESDEMGFRVARDKSTCTTCTRRLCTCYWASTTNAPQRSARKAATTASPTCTARWSIR